MKTINVAQAKEMFVYVAENMIKSKDLLTEIDSKIGDGDHGIGMELGFSKALEKVKDKEYETINDLYKEAGMAMLNSMGGASGVIFSSMFLNCFRGQPPVTEAGRCRLCCRLRARFGCH